MGSKTSPQDLGSRCEGPHRDQGDLGITPRSGCCQFCQARRERVLPAGTAEGW